jgi:hypothetical protein
VAHTVGQQIDDILSDAKTRGERLKGAARKRKTVTRQKGLGAEELAAKLKAIDEKLARNLFDYARTVVNIELPQGVVEVKRERQNTIATRRASIRRPIRTQCKGDPQLPPARKGRGWIFGPESPETTASGCSRDQHPTKKRLAEAETPTPINFSCLRALTCAANMGDW